MFTPAHNGKNPWPNKIPWRLANVLKMSNTEHLRAAESLYYLVVKTKELIPKQILSVPCTTCGAAIGEVCELHTGAPRTEPHRDRRLSAAEALETQAQKAINSR